MTGSDSDTEFGTEVVPSTLTGISPLFRCLWPNTRYEWVRQDWYERISRFGRLSKELVELTRAWWLGLVDPSCSGARSPPKDSDPRGQTKEDMPLPGDRETATERGTNEGTGRGK
jgi:hypothetical protein